MLRVSVATLNRVIFPHSQDATWMLALERKATVLGENRVRVRAQPFGGTVRILNPDPLREIIGELQFDSEQSKHEQDFRILIPPSQWERVKQYCLHRLEISDDRELESLPDRELEEEFAETIGICLDRDQYTFQALGTIVENEPIPTDNAEVQGLPTVHLYRVFETRMIDRSLCRKMLAASQTYSDLDLERLASNDLRTGSRGRANSILTLPLTRVKESYLAVPSAMRYTQIMVENHELDVSVLAVLDDVDLPQYQRR